MITLSMTEFANAKVVFDPASEQALRLAGLVKTRPRKCGLLVYPAAHPLNLDAYSIDRHPVGKDFGIREYHRVGIIDVSKSTGVNLNFSSNANDYTSPRTIAKGSVDRDSGYQFIVEKPAKYTGGAVEESSDIGPFEKKENQPTYELYYTLRAYTRMEADAAKKVIALCQKGDPECACVRRN